MVRYNNTFSSLRFHFCQSSPEYGGWVVDTFARTTQMSTYLVALVVSDFDFVESYFGDKPTRVLIFF